MVPYGDDLRRRRRESGLTQRELASRSGAPQPNIAAYERGRRVPAAATREKLESTLSIPTLERVRALRGPLLEAAKARRLGDVRVFGSVARGRAGTGSDVDLLVHPLPDASVFDLAGFMVDAADLLGVDVDVVSDRGTGPAIDHIRAEAVAL